MKKNKKEERRRIKGRKKATNNLTVQEEENCEGSLRGETSIVLRMKVHTLALGKERSTTTKKHCLQITTKTTNITKYYSDNVVLLLFRADSFALSYERERERERERSNVNFCVKKSHWIEHQ